ncbi:MAG: hypothetical protein L0154_26525 [Chloroflexi bacterium]|nr:hypothetical protein [Chloroflexota bacterium]
MNYPQLLRVMLAGLLLLLAILACATGQENLQIENAPQYVCPSATPRPTHTLPPADPPTYPAYFQANLASTYYQSIGPITLQLAMQNAGAIYASYRGARLNPPYVWEGTNGQFITIATSSTLPSTGDWYLFVPSDVYRVDFTLYSQQAPGLHLLTAYQSSTFSTAQPPLCCPPSPIEPTLRPTNTPYPTPTPYVRTNDYFVGDIVYTDESPSGLQLGFRMLNIRSEPLPPVPGSDPQALHIWTIEISNIGDIPYTLFPPAQMYVSVVQDGATETSGVWGPSLAAAQAADLDFNYMTWDFQEILPGQEITLTLAAFGPPGTAYKVSYALDGSQRGDDPLAPTIVPGTNIVSWINAVNTICQGEIEQP